MVTLYNTISSDGFIARKDGSEDFIPDELWPSFLKLCMQYSSFVMGRKTYDALQNYGQKLLEPFEKLTIKKIVVTNNRNFHPKPGYIVANSLDDALGHGPDVLVSSGPILNTSLLKNGLIDKVIFYAVPVTVGEGIKPFDIETERYLIPASPPRSTEGVTIYEYRVVH